MARFIEDHGAFEHIIEETTTHVKFDADVRSADQSDASLCKALARLLCSYGGGAWSPNFSIRITIMGYRRRYFLGTALLGT